MKESPSPSDANCTGVNAKNTVVEGIHLLDESGSLCASRRRASHTTTDQAAEEGLSTRKNQFLFDDTTRQCGGERALARNRSPSVHSLRDASGTASCTGARGQYQETTRKPQVQRFLNDERPNGGERQPDPLQFELSADAGASILIRDTFQTTLSTTTTTTEGGLRNNAVKDIASDHITATHIHTPFPTDDEETERKCLFDDCQPQCHRETLDSAGNQAHPKQSPNQDIVPPDPMNGIAGEKRLERVSATSEHAPKLLSSSESQRASAAEKDLSAGAEMHDKDTSRSSHSTSFLKATDQCNGARTRACQGRSGTHDDVEEQSKLPVTAKCSADDLSHETLLQGCLSPTNASEVKKDAVETKCQEETIAATTTTISDSGNLFFGERTERKSAACFSQGQCSGEPHDVPNNQMCPQQQRLEQHLAHRDPHVSTQEEAMATESAALSRSKTGNAETSKSTSKPHSLRQSLVSPGLVLETQPGCGSGISRANEGGNHGLFEENPSPPAASETTSCSCLGAIRTRQTDEQRQREQVLQESRKQISGKRQGLKRDAREMCSFTDENVPQSVSDAPAEQTVAIHHARQGSADQAATASTDQRRATLTRRKTIHCEYSSNPDRRALKQRSKTLIHFKYSEEEEIVCPLGAHQLDIFPSKHESLHAIGTTGHTSDGDGIEWEKIFNCVADELGVEWSKIGLELGVQYKDIEATKHKHHSNLFDAAFECLMKWKQMKGSEATVEELRRVLETKGFRSIVDNLSNRFPSVFCK